MVNRKALRSRCREVWECRGQGNLCALINGERGWLMLILPDDQGSFSSRDPGYRGPAGDTMDFLLANGQLDRYPVAWTLPVDVVERALQHFRETGERAPFVTWHLDY